MQSAQIAFNQILRRISEFVLKEESVNPKQTSYYDDFLQAINNSTASFSFSVTDKNYSSYGSIDLLPWDMIVEPYKNQTLTISGLTIDGNSENISLLNDYEIVWKKL
jgi:hypothetical protein